MNKYVRRCNSFFYIATKNRFAQFLDQPQLWTIDDLEITPRQMSFGVYSGTAITSVHSAEREAFTVLLNAGQAEITHQGVTYILEDYARFASRHLQNQYNDIDPEIAALNAEIAFWRWALPVIGILGLIALWWIIRWLMRTSMNAVRIKQHNQRKQRQLDAVQTAALKEQARLDVRERHTLSNPGTSRLIR